MRKPSLIALCFFCLSGLFAQGDKTSDQADKEELLEALKSQALVLSITSRQRDSSNRVIWENKQNKATVPGQAIVIRLEGSNLLIVTSFTPYKKSDQLSLLVQTQVWSNGSDTRALKYSSHVQSIAIKSGESFQFYPLGKSQPNDSPQAITMEMELMVQSFSEYKGGNL